MIKWSDVNDVLGIFDSHIKRGKQNNGFWRKKIGKTKQKFKKKYNTFSNFLFEGNLKLFELLIPKIALKFQTLNLLKKNLKKWA